MINVRINLSKEEYFPQKNCIFREVFSMNDVSIENEKKNIHSFIFFI